MENGKALDNMHLCAELLKWIGDKARSWLSCILGHALKHGFHLEWQESWVQPLFKGGDKNLVTNYKTTMVGSQMGHRTCKLP